MEMLKLLLTEAEKKSEMKASDICADKAMISKMATKCIAALKKSGEKLADMPMATVKQHCRSCVDACIIDEHDTHLSSDGLNKVVNCVLDEIKENHKTDLFESDDADLHKAAQAVIDGKMTLAQACEKYNLIKGELQGEINLIKDHEYRKKNSLAEAEDEQLEEGNIKYICKHKGRPCKIVAHYLGGKTVDVVYDDEPGYVTTNVKASELTDIQKVEEAYKPTGKPRGRPRKNAEEKPAAPAKKAASKPEADEDDDNKKVSSKALAKSMEKDDDEDDDDDVKRADDAASKEPPKKVIDTTVKADELKAAHKALSAKMSQALDMLDVKSAMAARKEMRAMFPKITDEELNAVGTIWRADNK
jgi:hypothetical protein